MGKTVSLSGPFKYQEVPPPTPGSRSPPPLPRGYEGPFFLSGRPWTETKHAKKCPNRSSRIKMLDATVRACHGLINYTDTKAKCCHLKILTCIGTLRQVFIRVYRLEIKSGMLAFFTQLPPLLYANKYVYMYTVCKGEEGGIWCSGPQTDKHLPQGLSTGQLF
jgi:hypothetical protein